MKTKEELENALAALEDEAKQLESELQDEGNNSVVPVLVRRQLQNTAQRDLLKWILGLH